MATGDKEPFGTLSLKDFLATEVRGKYLDELKERGLTKEEIRLLIVIHTRTTLFIDYDHTIVYMYNLLHTNISYTVCRIIEDESQRIVREKQYGAHPDAQRDRLAAIKQVTEM